MVERLIITPFQKFAKIESLSGILLFGATILALIWANSPFQYLYDSLWQYKIGFSTESFSLYKPLILWINDGLMTIFFFLIGLELKRELLIGELDTPRKAAFPFFAAIGGMVIPVILFIVLNKNPETSGGWGIPMAADIAFTLAILNLLGKRIPVSLKVFLTAFAIIDDIGAITVIAIFYSSSIKWILLAYALIPFALLIWLSYKRIHSKYVFLICSVIIWVLFLKSGIHPTVAGVLLAFTVPIRQKMNISTYAGKLVEIAKSIKPGDENKNYILTKQQIAQIDDLEEISDSVQSPLQQLEHRLHNWVAYLIVPLFALSNAGVSFNTDMNLDVALILNTAICLVVGNFLGVSVLSFLTLKFKLTELPKNTQFKHILGIAFLAGVGFTMSIFIANLAFISNPVYIDSAKIGILAGSLFSGLSGFILLKLTSKNQVE
uniref:Na+/H+ antiporter NhaA n=1 Tax=uncultured Draconibacterium sp. TaxID=1573823 RepID=UPI003216EB64